MMASFRSGVVRWMMRPAPWLPASFMASVIVLSLAGCTSRDVQPPLESSTPAIQDSATEPAQPEATSDSPSDSPSDSSSGTATPAAQSDDSLWAQLQQANTHYFVLMRHALAPGTGDPANFQLDDCSTQRNLSEEGRSQARQAGEAFKQRGIPVQRVLSSQWCRCLETAELMDLGPVEPFPPLNSFFQERGKEAERTAATRDVMLTQADEPGVTVMVTHFVNIGALSGVNVSSGDMVVMRVTDEDELEVVGQLDL